MRALIQTVIERKTFANILMVLFLAGGLVSALCIKQELFPDRVPGVIRIEVELDGAGPEEITSSILIAIENSISGVEDIKRVTSVAYHGKGVVEISLQKGSDACKIRDEVKNAVESITTFPEQAKKPLVGIPSEKEKALSVVIYGDQPPLWLNRTAQSIRDDLHILAGLSRVELAFPYEHEISVEVSEKTLHQYNLSLEEIAESIRNSSLEMPGGTVYSKNFEIYIRTDNRKHSVQEFGDIIIPRGSSSIPLYLHEIAQIREGFGAAPVECWFNGKPAVQLDVYTSDHETPVSVEAAVQWYINTLVHERYQGVEVVIFENEAASYRSRTALLIKNGQIGLLLVLFTLGLFLTPHVAFWVMVGIPTSLLGGMLLLPLFTTSLNMISLFAFIVTIGVVVDDAIMIGEAIHAHRSKGLSAVPAAVEGIKEMGSSIVLATSTTIIAFMPMFFVPGEMGTLFQQIPAVVIAVLLVSLIESLFILSSHLSGEYPRWRWIKWLSRPQKLVNSALEKFIHGTFRNFLNKTLRYPGVMISSAVSLLLFTFAVVAAGWLGFSFTPTIEADMVLAQAALPYGTPKEKSIQVQERLVRSAMNVLKQHSMESLGIFSLIGTRLEEGEVEIESLAGTNYISVLMALPEEKKRVLSGTEFAGEWKKTFGDLGILESLHFTGETNITGGEPIQIEIFHEHTEIARDAALSLGKQLKSVAGLSSIDDGIRTGKPEYIITIKDKGRSMQITPADVSNQIRNRFHGAEACRYIDDGNEIRVMVRLDSSARSNLDGIENILLHSPSGEKVPLAELADIKRSTTYTHSVRRDGRRIFPVTADVRFGVEDDMIEELLEEEIVPSLKDTFPGIVVSFGGEEEEIDESLAAMGKGFLIVLVVMYCVLSCYYNSYLLPLLILCVMPFSLIGIIWGHIIMGCELSIVSIVGIIAMTGVVVNDSIVLVTAYNRQILAGMDRSQAITAAACRRFRPILLTSLTTFLGLVPLLLETSEQAQFLIPAAISMSFGLVFGTVITLVLVPVMLLLFTGGMEKNSLGGESAVMSYPAEKSMG